mgnify:CR=1 FL=1
MTSSCRAVESKMVSNINGTNTFTFKMYYTYVDNITGEKFDNPFINLLVNERKIKVHWPQANSDKEWYDLIIKKGEKDSSGKSLTFTCTDLYINELSKTGFDLEFDNELENNQGSVVELSTKVLDSSDWYVVGNNGRVQTVDDNGNVVDLDTTEISGVVPSDFVKQTNDEALIEQTGVNLSLAGTNAYNNDSINENSPVTLSATNATILIFYSTIPTVEELENGPITRRLQFLYNENGYTTEQDS